MKTLIVLLFLLTLTCQAGQCQVVSTIGDLQTFCFNLPLNTDKQTIIKAAKEKFQNGEVCNDSVGNYIQYFIDTAITYKHVAYKPLKTELSIYDLWDNTDETKVSDTTFLIDIDAYYGKGKRAQLLMKKEYEKLVKMFKNRFYKSKPYSILKNGVKAKGIDFYVPERNHAALTIGWAEDKEFGDCRVRILFTGL